MSLRHFFILLFLGALWGASYLFIRIASPVLGPLLLMDIRAWLACAVLIVYALFRGMKPDFKGRWREFVFISFINAALPFALIAYAQLTLGASIASILNATVPLFTASIAALWLKQPLSPRQIVGIVLGFAGVIVLVGGASLTLDTAFILAALASLAAAFCYGIGNNYVAHNLKDVAPLSLSIGQLLGAGLFLLIPALLSPPREPVTDDVIFAVLGLVVLSTSLAYLMYFYLLSSVGATRTSMVAFLIPVFGTLWGVMFLGETITAGMLVGMVMILISVGLVVMGKAKKRKSSGFE
ncbi:MAG: DMT family transporter [Aggregatilineales bacterium]